MSNIKRYKINDSVFHYRRAMCNDWPPDCQQIWIKTEGSDWFIVEFHAMETNQEFVMEGINDYDRCLPSGGASIPWSKVTEWAPLIVPEQEK